MKAEWVSTIDCTKHYPCTAGSVYSDFGAYLKFGQPPGWRYEQYDFRPRWSFGEEQDSNMEIVFDPTTPGFQTGTFTYILLIAA